MTGDDTSLEDQICEVREAHVMVAWAVATAVGAEDGWGIAAANGGVGVGARRLVFATASAAATAPRQPDASQTESHQAAGQVLREQPHLAATATAGILACAFGWGCGSGDSLRLPCWGLYCRSGLYCLCCWCWCCLCCWCWCLCLCWWCWC